MQGYKKVQLFIHLSAELCTFTKPIDKAGMNGIFSVEIQYFRKI